jgi:hypothetical protein
MATWDCVAWGEKGREIGVLCFVGGEQGRQRRCPDLETCKAVMTGERQRVYARIQELAASGIDPFWEEFAEHFPSPDGLLYGESEE